MRDDIRPHMLDPFLLYSLLFCSLRVLVAHFAKPTHFPFVVSLSHPTRALLDLAHLARLAHLADLVGMHVRLVFASFRFHTRLFPLLLLACCCPTLRSLWFVSYLSLLFLY